MDLRRDYPAWTHYSEGNPLGERRIYCGRLLYVLPDDHNHPRVWRWHCGAVWGRREFATCAEAKHAAEEWARYSAA